ncbi:UdgX family uracil-DNA binding protein [Granulibacter bethesdensis]|uniref:UdgX family uracil-DNA binding protein n=1 Tax=Granulibacter bethesdensis TaxID=364410 RepID=UPI0003F2047B|nr:UdgX family uracil-DNA binding protein [Granulibacter bethesdensis]AHJ66010.1 Uracil DNA glycosylase superfamily protein [Granulibacter bethesdensis CGDNIH4]
MTYTVHLPDTACFTAWRQAAQLAISHTIPPEDIDWSGVETLFGLTHLPKERGPRRVAVPPAFLSLAETVIWHRAQDRGGLLYQALWRISRGDLAALSPSDGLGRTLTLMASAVKRDIHKMHAFVRFREIAGEHTRRRFVAWFEPEHHTLEPASPFFVQRFADMDWMIATPDLSAHFTEGALRFGAGMPRPNLPEDASAALWDTYFANIFNPARIKLSAMRSEMPKKYWRNLPETRLIPDMLADAEARVQRMHQAGTTAPRPGAAAISARYRASMPVATEAPPETLDEAGQAARQCRRCSLCEAATRTVWGEGDAGASLMIVGEQPGDREDLEGRPFVGPAGQVLRDLMGKVGMAEEEVWLTNAVKHFKFLPRGRHRLHQSPDRKEIEACRWWLDLELSLVRPRLTLALGASAAFALTGNRAAMTRRRGMVEEGLHGGPVLISWHPSFILRLPNPQESEKARLELEQDLRTAWQMREAGDITSSAGGAL